MPSSNRKWVLVSRPVDEVEESNFELREEAIADPADGQVLLRNEVLTVNPPMRMALVSGGITGKPYPIGRVMYGGGLARVAKSRHADFSEGDLVQGELGWQEFNLIDPGKRLAIKKVQAPADLPETTLMHVLGSSGATAWFGIVEFARPRAGDTFVVSTAAGSVGAIVCQLARLQGCRVIGIAGSDEKCVWVRDGLGATGVINYRRENVAERLRELCPNGIDIYFDNVGGETLDAVLGQIAFGARVVLCGGTSQYNHDLEWYGPKNYFNLVYRQAIMSGFYVSNFAHRNTEAHSRLAALLRDGTLHYAEDVLNGIQNVPKALIRILKGENFGVPLIKLV
ncbi:MAG: NADP-dependent oxidoreductase [Gammaproteobacteria bacterium]|nr:NADP-dependent oxidoreductase [Gammaproteobacteria bacterium]